MSMFRILNHDSPAVVAEPVPHSDWTGLPMLLQPQVAPERWGRRMQAVQDVPEITMPKWAGLMKGRPITTEEFERMLERTAEVVGEAQADSWKFLLNGLWWSGLRLGEALALSWDHGTGFTVDLKGRHAMFVVSAASEKGKQNRQLPMAPEFAAMLESVSKADRTGFVFEPQARRGVRAIRRVDTASTMIVNIGRVAGVKACEKESGRVKFASAHDLRRSFGFWWAMRVMPPILMQLMRHESIQTTQEFYVGRNADAAASVVWDAFEKLVVDNPAETEKKESTV